KYELAVAHGGEAAQTALSKGAKTDDILTIADASPEERGVYQDIHDIVRSRLNDPRSTANVEQPVGALAGDKLREVVTQQNAAGQAIGALRETFSNKPT